MQINPMALEPVHEAYRTETRVITSEQKGLEEEINKDDEYKKVMLSIDKEVTERCSLQKILEQLWQEYEALEKLERTNLTLSSFQFSLHSLSEDLSYLFPISWLILKNQSPHQAVLAEMSGPLVGLSTLVQKIIQWYLYSDTNFSIQLKKLNKEKEELQQRIYKKLTTQNQLTPLSIQSSLSEQASSPNRSIQIQVAAMNTTPSSPAALFYFENLSISSSPPRVSQVNIESLDKLYNENQIKIISNPYQKKPKRPERLEIREKMNPYMAFFNNVKNSPTIADQDKEEKLIDSIHTVSANYLRLKETLEILWQEYNSLVKYNEEDAILATFKFSLDFLSSDLVDFISTYTPVSGSALKNSTVKELLSAEVSNTPIYLSMLVQKTIKLYSHQTLCLVIQLDKLNKEHAELNRSFQPHLTTHQAPSFRSSSALNSITKPKKMKQPKVKNTVKFLNGINPENKKELIPCEAPFPKRTKNPNQIKTNTKIDPFISYFKYQ